MSQYEVQTFCPDCGKRKRYINRQKQVYYCFVCGAKGRVENVEGLGIVGISPDDPRECNKGVEPPPENWALTDFDTRYLIETRGISRDILDSLEGQIRSTQHGILFFFPEWEDYWQERRWEAFRPPPWRFPKYSEVNTKTGVGYFVESERSTNFVVICEGIIDALKLYSAGYSAYGILSKKFHDAQAAWLADRYERCVIMLDSDATSYDISQAVLTAGVFFEEVEICRMIEGDPADMTIEDLQEVLSE